MKKSLIIIAALFLFSNYSYPQNKIDGSYKGAVIVAGMNIEMTVRFRTESDSIVGSADMQGLKDLPLTQIKYEDPSFNFVLQNPNPKNNAYFEGIVYPDSISGVFKQSLYVGRFFLKPSTEVPQQDTTPKIALPYKEEEVTFKNGNESFAGTLTIPFKEGKHPAVIMITGSGPQDRNEEILGFKIFGIIADKLTRDGIAVLRYDDRNVGKSKGTDVSNSTTADFAGDVIEAVKFLKGRNDINPDQIGLFGHSEGGIVAPLAASQNSDIAFIILMAGTAVSGEDVIMEQSRAIMTANGEADSNITTSLKYSKKIMDAVVKNEDLTQLKKDLKIEFLKEYDLLSEDDKKSITNKEEYAEGKVEGTIQAFSSPWMKYFLAYDPEPALEKVKCPVLALFGELDMQVLPSQNEELMREALKKSGNKDFTIKVFPKANHLFQTANNGSPKEYGKLPKEFVDGFLDYVSGWIASRVTIIK
jgi:uncharacterized protein